LRRPTRGRLGNGLRVTVGTVLATEGELTVRTRERSIQLQPKDDGTTDVLSVEPWKGAGTEIIIRLGPALEVGADVFVWAEQAAALADKGISYPGRSSPLWYDGDAFWEWLQSGGSSTVREQIMTLEGCGSGAGGKIASAYSGRTAESLTRPEADALLLAAR